MEIVPFVFNSPAGWVNLRTRGKGPSTGEPLPLSDPSAWVVDIQARLLQAEQDVQALGELERIGELVDESIAEQVRNQYEFMAGIVQKMYDELKSDGIISQ